MSVVLLTVFSLPFQCSKFLLLFFFVWELVFIAILSVYGAGGKVLIFSQPRMLSFFLYCWRISAVDGRPVAAILSFLLLETIVAHSSGLHDDQLNKQEVISWGCTLHSHTDPNITAYTKSTSSYNPQQASAGHTSHHQSRKLLVWLLQTASLFPYESWSLCCLARVSAPPLLVLGAVPFFLF